MRKKPLTLVARKLAVLLHDQGYTQHGTVLTRAGDDAYSLIEVQRGREGSSNGEVWFVLNGGVRLRALGDEAPRTMTDCHWSTRALDSSGAEKWWVLTPTDSVDDIVPRLWPDVAQLADTLTGVAREESLLNLWCGGKSPGLSASERVKLLGTLLLKRGDKQGVARLIESVQDSPNPAVVRERERLRNQL